MPPALSESTKNGDRVVLLEALARSVAPLLRPAVPPCSTSPGRPKTAAEERGERRRHLAELREDEHLLLPRGDDLARSRAGAPSLPLSASAQPPSPSHCDGWLQICLKRMREASTMPAALDALASSSSSASRRARAPASW